MEINKLKLQYEKLGKEIEKLENPNNEKWYKILAPMWTDSDGTTSRYNISYINKTALQKVNDYILLEEYSDKKMMTDIIEMDLNGL